MQRGEAIKGHLDGLLLAVVADGPVHGYAVLERLRERSDGRFDLPEGTVYPALHRLEADGLLSSRWAVVAGRRRRQYELTDRGRRELGERARDWRRFAAAVERFLGAAPAAVGAPAHTGSPA
ncbi:MAG TPA: helix-turn-helix transcriptional regulator [Solirubrobacteraceae bacterium]|nr:helix-turn-helix transcriptional regulator [Solirubrobacteraceae bacterium]